MATGSAQAARDRRDAAGYRQRVPKRAGFLDQIERCRREVAQWPEWMRQERTVPAWMATHATDL